MGRRVGLAESINEEMRLRDNDKNGFYINGNRLILRIQLGDRV